MSETANSLDPFLVVVLQGFTKEEPTIVPQSWLCDNNSFVMWPPSVASKSTICKKVTPGINWLKYQVLRVYWKTATDNYQEASQYLEIAEETSGEESIEQKFAEMQDPKKRKYRHQKYLNSDNDSIQDPKIIKIFQSESVIQGSVNETKNLANPLELSKLPEILTHQNSEKQNETTTVSSEPEPSNNNIKKNVEHNDIITEDKCNQVDGIESTASFEINDSLANEDDKTGSKSVVECEPKTKKGKPIVTSNEILLNKRIRILPYNKMVKNKVHNTTKLEIDVEDLESNDNNPSKAFLKKLSSMERNDGLDFLKTPLNQNIHNKTTLKDNERPGTSKASDQVQNDTMDYARPASSEANEYSALKIDGWNKFKPEKFVELAINEKLNVLGLQQQQIIANQAKLAVAIDVKRSVTSTQESSLSLDETISMKGFLPIEDPDTFEAFDENLRDDVTFRAKAWQFLEPYMSKTNWKETVRKMIIKVMCNEVQTLYSCRGQKGKIPFNQTFFYELIEAATTKRPEKKYRAEEKQVLTYISEYLKHAKTRLLGASANEVNGRAKKKGSKCNARKGKSLMSKKEKERIALSLMNQSVDSRDEDDSG